MKRIHIGLEVGDLERSIVFYSALFGAEPTVREADYAKWMLDDPRVNFSITARCCEPAGSVHFGIQVEAPGELSEVAERLARADETVVAEENALCCYHKSDKVWAIDPDAFLWETFHTTGRHTAYGEDFAALEAARRDRLSHPEHL